MELGLERRADQGDGHPVWEGQAQLGPSRRGVWGQAGLEVGVSPVIVMAHMYMCVCAQGSF